MKIILIATFLIFLPQSFAGTNVQCNWREFQIKFVTDKKIDMYVEFFKNDTKVMACIFGVSSYQDGKESVTPDEVFTINKKSCKIDYEKSASEIPVIDRGFIKHLNQNKFTSVYIIKDEQPLICSFKKIK